MISDTNRKIEVHPFCVGFLETNCYLVFERESKEGILIDPGAYDKRIKDLIDNTRLKINFTVNTHGHIDHIMGNPEFGYPVLIHKLDAHLLSDAISNGSFLLNSFVRPVKPHGLLSDGDKITIGRSEIEVIHTPGHTRGGISLRFDDILFSGDTLFFEGVGRTDLPGGDTSALVRSIRERLFILPDNTRVFPGHGPDTTIKHEKESGVV